MALPAPPLSAVAVRRLVLVAVVAAVTGLAVWVVSPRFDIAGPSLVDDWSAISRSDDQLGDVARLRNPEEERFRPGWIAWNYVQWHTFGAPHSLVGPNLWNVLRILVLVGGLGLLTLLVLPPPASRREAALQAALAGMPALLVVTAPRFAVEIARFGPQEPLLLGATALGGSLLVLVARALLDLATPLAAWRTAALALAGSCLWALGVYQKETSLAALPLLAAVVLAGRVRLRDWKRLSRGRTRALLGMGVVVAAPLVHVALESALIVLRGDLVYDAEVDGGRGLAEGARNLYDWGHEALPPRWEWLVVEALALTVAAAVVRRRVDTIALGVLGSAGLAFLLAAQSGVVASRYLLPVFALVCVSLALALSRLSPIVQVAGMFSVVVALAPLPDARGEVARWSAREIAEVRLVRTVAELAGNGCRVAAAGLAEEHARALPVLLGLHESGAQGDCDRALYVVAGDLEEGRALLQACEPAGLEPLLDTVSADLYRCRRLRDGVVRDPALGAVSARDLAELRRLRRLH
jgi:hypothetical protein